MFSLEGWIFSFYPSSPELGRRSRPPDARSTSLFCFMDIPFFFIFAPRSFASRLHCDASKRTLSWSRSFLLLYLSPFPSSSPFLFSARAVRVGFSWVFLSLFSSPSLSPLLRRKPFWVPFQVKELNNSTLIRGFSPLFSSSLFSPPLLFLRSSSFSGLPFKELKKKGFFLSFFPPFPWGRHPFARRFLFLLLFSFPPLSPCRCADSP